MNLTLRIRLTLWYTLVLLVVLLAGGITVSWLHGTLGIARIDDELRDQAETVMGLIRAELDDGVDAAEAATESVGDLRLPNTGVAVLSSVQGQVLAARAFGVRSLSAQALMGDVSVERPAASHDGLRLRLVTEHYRGHALRIVTWTSLAGFERERATLHRALWLVVPLAVFIAGIGGWSIARRGLSPLTDMARQAEGITPSRPDDRLSQPPRRDELGILASAFNGLLDRLAGALRVQREFMADASHQLRTPVSIARIAAEVTLSVHDRSPQEYREALTITATQTRRLTEMIDKMFTLALADVNARPLRSTDFYFDDLAHDCARAAQVLAVNRGVTIRTNASAEVLFRGDEDLLRQMIMNLIDNAVRHTPADGAVDLTVTARNGEVRVSIADSGPGIAKDDQGRIFERFVRLENAESAGGGGLGLSIARWVAEAHRGSLTLESSGPTGSLFVALLPIPHETSAD